MNFKITLWKTLISIILGIIGGWFYLYINARNFLTGGLNPSPYSFLIFGFVISFSLIYIIWSLIQKKQKTKPLK